MTCFPYRLTPTGGSLKLKKQAFLPFNAFDLYCIIIIAIRKKTVKSVHKIFTDIILIAFKSPKKSIFTPLQMYIYVL